MEHKAQRIESSMRKKLEVATGQPVSSYGEEMIDQLREKFNSLTSKSEKVKS